MRKQSTCDVCSKRQTVAVGFGKAQGRTALLLRLVHRNVSAVTSTSQSRPYVATESSTSGILVSIAMVKDLENRVTYSTAPVVGNTKGTAPATRSACITAVEFWPAQSVSDAPNSYRSPGRVIVGSSRSALWRSEFAATTISSKPGCSLSLVILASLYASTGLAFIMTNTAATAVVGIAGLGFLGYFAEVALAHRKSRLDAHLASQRSIQAQKMEATGQLVGGVAHDFNNILTAVIGNLELYSEVDLAQDKDHFVAEARSSAMIAAKLIKQLMAYSRLSKLEASETHLADLFDQLQGLSRRLLPKSITLEFVKPRADLKINVDPNQLITALINLLVNARDALDDKGLVVVDCQEVGVDSRSARLNGYSLEDGRYVEIRVKDNGPGVDRSIIDNVTTPFFTTKPVGKGSGLGLSMVEGFARQSGGGLLVTSSSAGACFSVFLPISSAHNVASATLAT